MMNESSALNVRHRRGKYDVAKTAYVAATPTPLVKGINDIYEHNGKFYLVRVVEILPPGEKAFDEAKGAITSDYQSHLEKQWLEELAKKHTIVVDYDVLYNIGK